MEFENISERDGVGEGTEPCIFRIHLTKAEYEWLGERPALRVRELIQDGMIENELDSSNLISYGPPWDLTKDVPKYPTAKAVEYSCRRLYNLLSKPASIDVKWSNPETGRTERFFTAQAFTPPEIKQEMMRAELEAMHEQETEHLRLLDDPDSKIEGIE